MELFLVEIISFCVLSALLVGLAVWFFTKKRFEDEMFDAERGFMEEKQSILLELTQRESELKHLSESQIALRAAINELEKDFNTEKGKSEQQKEELTRIESKLGSATRAYEMLNKQKANLEEKIEARETERQKVMTEMLQSKRGFEHEKQEFHAKKEKLAEEKYEEKQRTWANHEKVVIDHLKFICQKPELGVMGYDNLRPPEVLSGIKPDFCVPFLDQFVIFDAKTTTVEREKSMWTYLQSNTKSSATKYAKAEKVYHQVFFVVPDTALPNLRQTHLHEGGFDFFFVPMAACEPILKILKKVEYYQTLKDWDPAEREGIIQLMAQYEHFMNFRNATDVLMAEKSIEMMDGKLKIPGDVSEQIESHKRTFKIPSIKPSDRKAMMQTPDRQTKAINQIKSPKENLPKEMLDEAENLFDA